MIIRSFGAITTMTEPNPPTWADPAGSLNLYGHRQTYAEIYRTQPNVRVCIDFLARNIAHLGLPVYRRISDTDRERLTDHELAQWLNRPNASTRRYRLIESLMGDLGIYFNAYWAKVRYQGENGRPAIGLVRLPPEDMRVEGGILPSHYCWTSNGVERDFPLSEIVYFNGYNPLNPLMGLSPLETLRRVLAEEWAAGDHREAFWRNSARMELAVTRPKEKPRYTKEQAQSWREQWQAAYGGGAGSGKTVLLQDGETVTPMSWSAKDAEYISARKLTREECAAAYHIPQPLVGILDHATFSNIKEQHKHLYQDTLGPWLEMIQQEIEGQLLTECTDQNNVYLEFNIDAKLAGTPEERAQSLQLAVGRPWRTVNEARALENLPRIDDDELDTVAPQQGGPANTPPAPADDAAAVAEVIQATQARQRVRLEKVAIADRPAAFNVARWDAELAANLEPLLGVDEAAIVAIRVNAETMARLQAEAADV